MIAEVVDTLKAICDEIIICDGYSTDGTLEYLQTRDDIQLFQDNWNLNSDNGLEFAKITNHGLKRCTGDYIVYLQADELIHEDQIEPLRQLILSNKYNSIYCKFHHIRYDFDHYLTGGYKRAARVIRNGIGISSTHDGYDFTGNLEPRCISGIDIYHFGYVFIENILNKMINHSENFYVHAPNYANRKKLAQGYLKRIETGESINPLEMQKVLEPEYVLAKHGLPLPACMERLQEHIVKPVQKYTLPPPPPDTEPETPIKTIKDLAEHAAYWDIKGIKFDRSHRGTVWINENNKIAALGIPKCATTTIRTQFALTKLVNIQDVPDDYFMFAIIRDPINRFVSAYIEVVQKCKIYPKGRYHYDLSISQDQIEFLDDLMANHDDCGRFMIYLNQVQNEWGFFETHCVPQIIYLFDNDNKIFPNVEIFRFDNLINLEERLGTKMVKSNQSENPELKQKLLAFIAASSAIKSQIEKLYEYDSRIWQEYEL
jgi:hypothetical protein